MGDWYVMALICIVVGLLNVTAHWFPWNVFPSLSDGYGKPRRVLAYAYGSGVVLLGMVAWAIGAGEAVSPWAAVGAMALVTAAAGIGTLVGYAVDLAAEARAAAADMADIDERLAEM